MYEKDGSFLIDLRKIPQDGSFYSFTQKDKKSLCHLLEPIISKNPFLIQVTIQPLLDYYQITTHLEIQYDLMCSRCAVDFKKEVNTNTIEYVIVNADRFDLDKSDFSHHISSNHDENPFCHYVKSPQFNLSAFLFEQVAMSEPTLPLGKENCDDTCENYKEAIENGWIKKENNQVTSNPFSVLKAIKPQK